MADKIMRRLKKLLALAERGVGGEKENAERMLQNLMRIHGISMDDLGCDERTTQWLRYRGPKGRDLMNQIVLKVVGRDVKRYTCQGFRNRLGADLTAAEHAEVLVLFDAYANSLKEQLQTAFIAFIHKHDIFPEADHDEEQESTMSLAELARLQAMVDAMPDVQINKRIGHNS